MNLDEGQSEFPSCTSTTVLGLVFLFFGDSRVVAAEAATVSWRPRAALGAAGGGRA